MKKIKPIVLKNATMLTNSEMKKIRGGYEPEKEYPAECSAVCYNTGAIIGSVTAVCAGNINSFCDIISGSHGELGVGCYAISQLTGSAYLLNNTEQLCSLDLLVK